MKPGGGVESAGPRLALVEILGPDRYRHFRRELYPFIQGFARSRGVPALWLRVGVKAQADGNNRFVIEFEAQDRARLIQHLGRFGATHAIFNEKISPSSEQGLREELPGLVMITGGEEAELSDLGSIATLAARLGVPRTAGSKEDGGADLVANVTPDYRSEPLNPLAEEVRPFVTVLCGPSCLYRRSLQRNPLFRGVELPEAAAAGCSFCERVEPPTKVEPGLVDLAVDQVRLACQVASAGSAAPSFLIGGSPVFFQIETFFERILELDLPGAEFFFSCRVDEFLARADQIEAVLPRLRERGFSIHIHNMGVENFSAAENARFNKGIATEEVFAAHDRLRRLESTYPGTFVFFEHGGFAFILFTPWTTVSDLALNVESARRLGIEGDSFFLRSRLQLIPGRAITLLAQHDGLLAESFEDMDFDSGCITTWSMEEIPWRFRHPEVQTAYHLMSRLGTRDAREPTGFGAAYERIQQWRSRLPRPCDHPLIISDLLLEVLGEDPGATLEVALERTASRLEDRHRNETLPSVEGWTPPSEAEPGEDPGPEVLEIAELGSLMRRAVGLLSREGGTPGLDLGEVEEVDGTLRAFLAEEGERTELVITPSKVVLQEGRERTTYQLWCRFPSPASREQRQAARLIAAAIDFRSTFSPDAPDAAGWLRSHGWDGLLETIEEAVHPRGGEPRLFAGYRAFWPVRQGAGAILLRLVAGDQVLDLFAEEKTEGRRFFAASERVAVSHFPSTQVDTAAKRAAIQSLLRSLRAAENLLWEPAGPGDHSGSGPV